MLSGPKGRSRVDLDQKLVLVLLRDLLPGGLYKDVIHSKRLEILLPVVDPVLILGLRGCDGPLADLHVLAQFRKPLIHFF